MENRNFGKFLNKVLEEKHITKRRFAKELGISEANIYKILKRSKVDTEMFVLIMNHLKIPSYEFFNDKPYSDLKNLNANSIKYIESLEREISTKNKLIERIEKENERLENELKSYCTENQH